MMKSNQRTPRRTPWPAVATACLALAPRLARADEGLDPKQECLVASDRGQNERDEGKYRAARRAFIACARTACPAVVVRTCSKWLSDLDATAPSIVLDVKDEQGNDLKSVWVTLDGETLAAAIDGRPLEVDTGSHVLRFEREGNEPVEQNLMFRAGERARVVRATMKSTPPETSAEPPPPSREAGAVAEVPGPAVITPRLATAASIAVAAAASAGVGAYFLVQSNQAANQASRLRSTLGASDACANAASTTCGALNDSVQTQHNDAAAATGLFIGAGALAVGAVAAWFLWPTPGTQSAQSSFWVAPAVAPTGAILHVGAAF